MSNYEANPVGFLYERYQSSGISPLYEVTLNRGQAHAPIFEAVLTVPEGHKVVAQGSSKKIAKNVAAKLMLDKLDGKSEQAILSVTGDDANNNPVNVDPEFLNPRLETLSNKPSMAASVARFYQKLQKSHGEVLESLHNGSICLGGDVSQDDFVPFLEMLAEEQHFDVKWLQLEDGEGVEQSLVQILSDVDTQAVTVCLGMGPFSKNWAARCALMYIKLMSKPDTEQ